MSIDSRTGERDICHTELQTQQPNTVYVLCNIFGKPEASGSVEIIGTSVCVWSI